MSRQGRCSTRSIRQPTRRPLTAPGPPWTGPSANIIPARLKAERYKELVGIKAVSAQDYDDAFAALKQAEADIAVNKAAVETARINLAYTQVSAPISGRIGKSSVTIGALVTASQSASLATIQQLDPVYVDVTQSSIEMLRLKRDLASGQIRRDSANQARVGLILEDGIAYPLKGILKFSDVTIDQSTGSVTLRTVFPNPNQVLLPGMYVRAVLEEGVIDGGDPGPAARGYPGSVGQCDGADCRDR